MAEVQEFRVTSPMKDCGLWDQQEQSDQRTKGVV